MVESIALLLMLLIRNIGTAGNRALGSRARSYLSCARLIPTAKDAGNYITISTTMLDVEGYIARVRPYFEKSGFYEK